jgi:hypothetical protein
MQIQQPRRVDPLERSAPLRRRAASPREDSPVFMLPLHDFLPDGQLPKGRARALDLLPETSVSRWLAQMRLALQGEINALAKHRKALPGDFEVRMKRLSLAMYLLERMNFLMRAADGNYEALGVFDPAVAKVRELLDDSYFRKDWGDIITGYMSAEDALRACASFCPFDLLDFNGAVDKYRPYVETRLERIDRNRQAPGVHIVIIA